MAGGPEPILLYILIIILGAKLGGSLAERFKQPAVLGELLVGVLLGASLLGGFIGLPDFGLEQDLHHEEDLLHDAQDSNNETLLGTAEGRFGGFMAEHGLEVSALEILGALATIGVILLLFEVGLESDIKELARVGKSSLFVAAIGVIASFAIGYGFSYGLANIWDPWHAANTAIPNNLLHLFIGATLTATSVGITARVLGDMGKLNTNETKIILGAAVIDDIAGLIILAIIAAMIDAALSGNAVNVVGLLIIAAKAIGFLVVSLAVGLKVVPRAFDGLADRMGGAGVQVALAIVFALLMAYLASWFGLADIVGAFAGGLILAQSKHSHQIFKDLRPIAAIFVSFFFVTLGMRVDLSAMEGNGAAVVAIGVTLTLLAMLAKLACGWGVTKDSNASKLVVGVGMSPRGEVGLIFAGLGLGAGLLTNWQYTAMIIVVMLTTFITPIWLEKLKDRFLGPGQEGPGTERREAMSHILEA